MPGYTFDFTLKADDVKTFQASWRRRRPLRRRMLPWLWALISGGVGLMLFVTELTATAEITDRNRTFALAVSSVIIAFMILFWTRINVHFGIRKMQREGADLFKPQTMVFSPATFTIRSTLASTEYQWQAVLEFVEDINATYLFLEKNQAFILPHHAIRDAGHEPVEVLKDLQAWRSNAPSRELQCPTCGYELKGTAVQGCPECGWAREAGVENS